MKKDLVVKPNQLIETSGNISAVQNKMYNVILARAHQELKKDPSQAEFYFDLEDIKTSAGVKDKNDDRLRGYLKKLSKISIEYMDNKEHWGGFNLISEYAREEDKILIGLPRTIRKALISNNYYTTLDLLMLKSLESKYSIALYEIALKYHKIQIPEYDIKTFRKITDTLKSKSYDDFGMLQRRILKPSVAEINEKTDIELSYELKKTGRKVTSIKFEVKKKPQLAIDSIEPILAKEVYSDDLKAIVIKAKKNMYISKAWDKRADSKIQRIFKEHGYEYTKDLFKRAYEGCQSDIKTTLVQYINGIIKNMKSEEVIKPELTIQTGKLKEVKNEVIEPEDKELQKFKEEVKKRAKQQLTNSFEFRGRVNGARSKEEVNKLIEEYSI